MIRNIKKIANYRAFTNWSPAESLDFADINVIYGTNGSGKSTLGEMLRGASTRVDISSGCELDVEMDGAAASAKAGDDHAIWERLHVFNREFVRANIRFDDPTGTTADPILRLGEAQIEAEEQAKILTAQLAEAEKQEQEHAAASKTAADAADKLLVDVAGRIKADARALNAYANYDKRKARTAIADTSGASTDLDADREILATARVDALSPITTTTFQTSDLLNEARAQLATTVAAQPITDLQEIYGAHSWVQQGLHLHDGRDACLFCDNAITPERRAALDAHFDDSVDQLDKNLAALSKRVSDRSAAATQAVEILKRITPSANLRDEWSEVLTAADTSLAVVTALLVTIGERIEQRRNNPFSHVELGDDIAATALNLAPLADIITRHNEAAANHEEQRTAAAQRIERCMLDEVKVDYNKHLAEKTEADTKQQEATVEVNRIKGELETARQEASTAGISAEELNRGFRSLFGRTDLVFSVRDDAYRILRGDEPAKDLSEGERNGIALLYFLASLRSKDVTLAEAIVVIDDPISSMDAHIASGVSALLLNRLVKADGTAKCEQLFVLTHDFELLATWVRRLNSRNIKERPHRGKIYEIRRSVTSEGEPAQPEFYLWDDEDRTRRARSEYHYLFWRVTKSLVECRTQPEADDTDFDVMFVLPNACRRLIEGLLGFKYPAAVGQFTSQMQAAGKDIGDEDGAAQLLGFLHSNSHNEEPDTQRISRRPEAINTLTTLLRFMRSVDEDHFKQMCKASKISERELLSAAEGEVAGDGA